MGKSIQTSYKLEPETKRKVDILAVLLGIRKKDVVKKAISLFAHKCSEEGLVNFSKGTKEILTKEFERLTHKDKKKTRVELLV